MVRLYIVDCAKPGLGVTRGRWEGVEGVSGKRKVSGGKEGEDDSEIVLSVSQRIFAARVKLMLALQDVKNQSIPWRVDYWKKLMGVVSATVDNLRKQRARISVRKAMPQLDVYREHEEWKKLTEVRVKRIMHSIVPLVEGSETENELVKLFDCHMLTIELPLAAGMAADAAADEVKKVRVAANRLMKLGTIAEVVAKKPELEKLESEDFWRKATLEEVEPLRVAVRDLMVYLQTDSMGKVTLNLADSIKALPSNVGTLDIRTYREKVIDYLAGQCANPVIDKIRKLEPITRDDLAELEKILWNELGTQQQYEDEHYRGTLAGFVRSLVDIDEEAVQEKFGEFLAGGTLNSAQQEFVHSIVDYLRENGEVTPDNLTNDEPFVNYDIAELFEDRMEEFRKLVGRLNALCHEAA